MIVHPNQERLVCNIPQVDGASLWLCDTRREQWLNVPVSGADSITLHQGEEGYFAVMHHYQGYCVEISAHHMIENPAHPVSRIRIEGTAWLFEGQDAVWRHLPRAYTTFYTSERLSEADDHLVLVNALQRTAEIHKFPPFYGGDTQKCRVKSILPVPRQQTVLVEQAEDENPFVFLNTKRHKPGQRLALTLKPGSSRSYAFRERANELWVADPDYVFRLAPGLLGDWQVKKSLRLQLADSTNGRYAGDLAFCRNETACVIARPFLGDALMIDVASFTPVKRIQMDGMPRTIALLPDGRVFSRDWLPVAFLRRQRLRNGQLLNVAENCEGTRH